MSNLCADPRGRKGSPDQRSGAPVELWNRRPRPRLRPHPDGPSFWAKKHRLQDCRLLEVSKPYTHQECRGGKCPIVPCTYRRPDGTEKVLKVIVCIRADAKAVITGIWLGE